MITSNETMIEKTSEARISGNWVVWNYKAEKIVKVSKSEPTKYYDMKGHKVLSPLKMHTFKRTLPAEFAFPSAYGLGIANDPEATL